MTGETMRDLLNTVVGRYGSISMLVSRTGPVAFSMAETKKLTAVELRPDGLVRLQRENGWAVIDPAEIVAVVWNDDPENRPGQFL